MQLCDVAHMNHVGETQLCHLNGKGFDLRRPHRRDATADRGQRESTNAIEQSCPSSVCSFRHRLYDRARGVDGGLRGIDSTH